MNEKHLIRPTESGLYCEAGDFFIDPWRPVKRAVITHAHADHAYRGHQTSLVCRDGLRLFQARLGAETQLEAIDYGAARSINGVKVSLHPAGHVLGSAQVRVEHRGEVWVASGDYKLTPDPTCAPFEPIRCHAFITEATFALPIYHWTPPEIVFDEVNEWWRRNRERGRASLILGYALGKAQRILAGVDANIGAIYAHGAVERLTEEYRLSGVALPPTEYVGTVKRKSDFRGSLIVAPPGAQDTIWTRRFGDYSAAFASGWMMIRGARRRRAVDRGFVLSDHADWSELLRAIEATGAEQIWVTHGYIDELVRWLREERGLDARPLRAGYAGDEDEGADEKAETED